MTFGRWPEEIHANTEQQKRIQFAKSSKVTPMSIDAENKVGFFGGPAKNQYRVSLDECTCADYIRRKIPCKHIYRLAMELGVFSGNYETTSHAGVDMVLSEAVGILENYSDELRQFLIPLFGVLTQKDNDPINWVEVDSTHEHIVGSSIYIKNFQPVEADFVFSEPFLDITRVGPDGIVPSLRKKDLDAILDKANIRPEQKLLKNELAKWCIENVPNLAEYLPERYYTVFSPSFQKIKHKTIKYLRRKYEWSYYYAETPSGMLKFYFPYGGIFEDELSYRQEISIRTDAEPLICHFPDDEITELLTLYGHNRCLNGFKAVEK